jgi:hypothetical protein
MFDAIRGGGLVAAAALGLVLGSVAPASAQDWATLKSSRQLWGDAPVSVNIEYGPGTLAVRPAASSMLYSMELRYDKRYFVPISDFDDAGRKLSLGIRNNDESRKNINLKEGSRASIQLTREVPLDLKLQFGAGEAAIELGGMRLRKLDLSTGASDTKVSFSAPNLIAAQNVHIQSGAAELTVTGLGNLGAEHLDFQGGVGSTTLDFSGKWNRNATASVQMGVGSITLRLPRGLGVQVNRSSFMSSFDAPGLTKRGESYFSSDWDRAAHRLTVNVNAAFGSIDVDWID